MDQSLEQEIRRLYSRFHSPRDLQGRTFVPLADAYRRSGDLLRARLLLEEGLRRHPDFASAHVVALRVARDVSDHEGAMKAARRVLQLDPGNTEARRALDHIGSQREVSPGSAPSVSGDDGEPALPEESWMVGDAGVWGPGTDSGLASVDPVALKEEDAQARSLAQTSGAAAEEAEEVEAEEVVAAAEAVASEEVVEAAAAASEATLPVEPEAGTSSDAPAEPTEEAEAVEAPGEAVEEAAAAAEAEAQEEVVTPEEAAAPEVKEAEAEEVVAAEEAEVEEVVAAAEAAVVEEEKAQPEATPPVEVEAETSSEAPAEPVESVAGRSPTRLRTERPESRGKSADRTADRPRKSALRKAPPAAEPTTPSSSSDDAKIYTRTMGQLYEQQGLYAHAIVVYEHLLESDPGDKGLSRHLERLRQPAGEEASTRSSTSRVRRFERDSVKIAPPDSRLPDDDELPPEPASERGTESVEAESFQDEEAAPQPATAPIPGSDLPVVPIESLAPDPPATGVKEGAP